MAELRQTVSDSRTELDAEGLSALVDVQHGVVSRQQLRDCGASNTMVARWLASGRLHRLHRQVFAVGHTNLSIEGRLTAAVLYAGQAAVLSHTTAAWLWRLIDTEPNRIHITIPGRLTSLPGVRVHHTRQISPAECRGFPVTPVARTLVDLASSLSFRQIRRALSEADYRNLVDPAEIESVLKRGRPGSRNLRDALRAHLPELAETEGVLEQAFLELCESWRIPLPEVNAQVGRMRVDALWLDQGVAVELDGGPAHGGVAAMKRDRSRELALRSKGFVVVRYSWEQVTGRSAEVAADVRRLLGLPAY